MRNIYILFITTIFFLSCESNNGQHYESMAESALYGTAVDEIDSNDADAKTTDPLQQAAPMQKKIIKDGRMGLRVNELEVTKQRIDSLLIKYKGYYAQETLQNEAYVSTFRLKIRVPNENYETLIAAIESGKGKILYKEIDTQDVTEQFVDIETRLNNKRNYLLRYQEILKQAKSIKEILEIEEYIRSLVEEIESAEGRLSYLNNQVTYSTLDLTVSKENDYKFTPERRENFFERLKEALSTGWDGFVDFIIFLLSVWPFWFILAGTIYLFVRWRKRKNKK
ncbi:MAG: DUF4349 domain-containing protein [Tannerellaceae bacterium]|jgi:hypothetical protein|nr:DUF4349 domain-containing protein [Tannerellaceae bacterium]